MQRIQMLHILHISIGSIHNSERFVIFYEAQSQYAELPFCSFIVAMSITHKGCVSKPSKKKPHRCLVRRHARF